MNNFKTILGVLSIAIAMLFSGCKFDDSTPVNNQTTEDKASPPHVLSDITVDAAHFQVTLLDGYPRKVGDNYEWRWKIVNPNPSQINSDLVQWNITLGSCARSSNIVSASYSYNGTSWQAFTPIVQVDQSLCCCSEAGATLRFPAGTTGSDPTYYSLVVNRDYLVSGETKMALKYGTTCSIHDFPGLGGDNTANMCFSQPVLAWAGNEKFNLTNYLYTRYLINMLRIPTVYNLVGAGGLSNLGTVTILDNGSTVTVKYKSAQGWYFSRTYLDYDCSTTGLHAYSGTPILSNFDLKNIHSPYVTEFSYTFNTPACSYRSVYLLTYVYIAQRVNC